MNEVIAESEDDGLHRSPWYQGSARSSSTGLRPADDAFGDEALLFFNPGSAPDAGPARLLAAPQATVSVETDAGYAVVLEVPLEAVQGQAVPFDVR